MLVNKSKIRAFSLIELSIVVLVIGILIAGIIGGNNFIEKTAIQSARALTNSSPVASIKDLLVWYETTSEKSFDSNVDMSNSSANQISIWYDINPTKPSKFNISQGTPSRRPVLTRAAINGLPALLFDGTNDFLENTTLLMDTKLPNYSIIVVGQCSNILKSNPIFGQYIAGDTSDHTNHFLRIDKDGVVNADQFTPFGGSTSTLRPFFIRKNENFIITLTRSNNAPLIYVNGILRTNISNTGETYDGITPNRTIVGYRSSVTDTTKYFSGYIAEIIIFDRTLRNEERNSIEKYLGQKWKIKVAI